MLQKSLPKTWLFITAILLTIIIYASTVYAVNCWMFSFSGSNPFPNPADSGTYVKENMNLCVLGDDYQTYPALIRSVVYNSLGQKVYERTESHNSSPNFQMVVWIVGSGVSNGTYTIKTRAESSLCGNSAWDVRSIVISN